MFPRRSLRFDIAVRLAGCAGTALGWLMLRHLFGHPDGAAPLRIGLAALGFLCVSGGAALVALGRHVADRVAVSSRWHRTG